MNAGLSAASRRWWPLTVTRRDDIRVLLGYVVRTDRRRLTWITVLQVAAAVGQGFGLVLLIPLLAAAGVHGAGNGSGGIAKFARLPFDLVDIRPTITVVLAVYVIVVGVSAALSGWSSVLLTRYQLEFVDRLRNRLFAAVAAAEWRQLLGLRRSDLLATLTVNVNTVGVGVLAVLSAGASLVLALVQTLVAIRISPAATGAALVTVAILVATTWPLVRRGRLLGRQLVARNAMVLATVTGFLDGLKLAKAHALEAGHVRTFDSSIAGARRAQIDFAKASAWATAVRAVVTVGALAIIVDIAVGGLQLPVTSLLVLAFIFSRLVPQISGLQRYLMRFSLAAGAFYDLTAIVTQCESDAEPRSLDGAPARLPIGSGVVLDYARFGYRPDRPVLWNVTVRIPARSTVALVGPSGAGKTTVADLVVGLLEPDGGRLCVDGRGVRREEIRAWRASVSLVPQEPFLFTASVRDNLVWAAPAAEEAQMWQALGVAAAADFVAALPEGLDTMMGDRGVRLSGGERQRIALARALLRGPDLLVLDEATSSLDTENELAIRRALAALHGRFTMLVIAHRLSTVRSADSVVVLDGGRVAETGTWNELAGREDSRLRSLIDAGGIAQDRGYGYGYD